MAVTKHSEVRRVNRIKVLALGLLVAASPAVASANLPPPNEQILGVVLAGGIVGSRYSCVVDAGPTQYQRAPSSAAPHRSIELIFPGIRLLEGAEVKSHYIGPATLKFSSATAGTISFDYDVVTGAAPSGQSAAFTGYRQELDDTAMKVHFIIHFPHCNPTLNAFFRSGPRS